MRKLLVVEDHALVREGLVQTLRQLETGASVFEASDCDGAGVMLAQEPGFDLLLLDLGLPGLDGISGLRMFHQRYPAMPIVIVSAYDDPHTVSKAMNCGAAAFVSKSSSSDHLLTVLRDVLAGRQPAEVLSPAASVVTSPHLTNGVGADPSEFGLTGRQSEVLGLMVLGKSNRDIAGLLGLSEGTVKIHLTAIFKALGVSSRTQAMVVVARHNIKL